MDEHETPMPSAPPDSQGESAAPVREPSQLAVAWMIADRLGETEAQARQQLVRTVQTLGRTQALALLEETMQIETSGGMMLPDGSRRRTIGGVFFWLVRTKGRPKEHPWLKHGKKRRQSDSTDGAARASETRSALHPTEAVPPLPWAERFAALAEIGTEKGRATIVKITLIGRPGTIIERGGCVVTTMQATKVPSLPKGLPTPSDVGTTYTVYIASKQWRKKEEAMKDQEDVLIVEGFPQIEADTNSIAVFVSNTTTKKLQMAQRPPAATKQTT